MAHRLFENAQTRRAARNITTPQHAIGGPEPVPIGESKPPIRPSPGFAPSTPVPIGGTVGGVVSPTFQEDQARIRDQLTRRPTIGSAVPAVPATPAVPSIAAAIPAAPATPAAPARQTPRRAQPPDFEGTGIEGDFTRGFNPDTENRLFRRSTRGSKPFTKAEFKRGYRKLK